MYRNTNDAQAGTSGQTFDQAGAGVAVPTTKVEMIYQNWTQRKGSLPQGTNGEDHLLSPLSVAKTATADTKSKNPNKLEEGPDDIEEYDDIYSHEDLYAMYSSVQHTRVDAFQKQLLDRLKTSDILEREFEGFPKGMQHPHDVGMDPKNKNKNRFQKLCAYDKNRVILNKAHNESETDYINASWIKGFNNDHAYIATQGPRANTVADLWWMVWQENLTQIINLTNLIEDGKDKCEKYWPNVGQTSVFGHLTVTSKEEKERADYTIRTFHIKVKEDKKTHRVVSQYHYVAWPDHGIPAATSLVNFWRYVTTRAQSSSPPVIHCSAGVGRTGTYIALDIAIGRKLHGQDVSIQDIVMELREQRCIMVQTIVQYKLLHEVVLEAYTSRNSRLTAEQLNTKFPTDVNINTHNTAIDEEFKLLQEMKEWAKPSHQTAALKENSNKIRDPSILPADEHIPFLRVYAKGRNQFINAVYISSFTKRRGLLLTQLPLPHTLVDLWRLVEGCDVTTILSIGAKDDEKTVKNFCSYWPKNLGSKLTTGPYTIRLNSVTADHEHIATNKVSLETQDKILSVQILHYTDWSGELPGEISDVLHLVKAVQTACQSNKAPVIIQCVDGATKSGLFCAVCDIVCQLTQDVEVNVFSIVRHVQSVRREAVTSEKQYRFLYKVAQQVRGSQSVYANV